MGAASLGYKPGFRIIEFSVRFDWKRGRGVVRHATDFVEVTMAIKRQETRLMKRKRSEEDRARKVQWRFRATSLKRGGGELKGKQFRTD